MRLTIVFQDRGTHREVGLEDGADTEKGEVCGMEAGGG